MSSDFMSHPVDVSKYDVIYAGAQKNLGPAGVTIVIVRTDALGHVERSIPTMLNYKTHADKGSMFNTPPCLPIYTSLQTMKWYKELGGLKVLEARNIEKSALLYDEIDRNRLFVGTAERADRSRMNVCFVMAPEYTELEEQFADYAKKQGMVGIKGHRSVGGFRASLYNAMPLEGVKALVQCMQEFEKTV
jgi:phosphoserine aminotransferase